MKKVCSIYVNIVLVGIIFLCIYPCTLSAKIIELDSTLSKIPIGRMMEYMVDPSGSVPIEDLKSQKYADRWKVPHEDGPGFGFTSDTYWVRFTVSNKTANDLEFLLEQEYALIDNINIYIPDGVKYNIIDVGRMKRFSERPYNYRTFIFPLKLKPGETVTYYLRYATTSSMNIPLILWSSKSFLDAAALEKYLLLLFNGIVITMIIYNLLLFFIIRWLEYLFYCLFIILYLLFMATLNGTAFQYLWPDSPDWGSFSMPVLLSLLYLFIGLFCIELVGIRSERHKSPYRNKIFQITVFFVILGVILTAACLILPYRYGMALSASMTGILLLIICIESAILIIKERNRQTIFGIIAAMPIIFGSLTFVLKTFSILPTNFYTEWSVYIGMLFMAVLFSLGLADKVNMIRKDLAILNVHLDDKVKERTEELNSTNLKLESINEDVTLTNKQLEEAQRIARRDMNMAVQVQRRILLSEPPQTDGWDIAFYLKPMSDVSGDFYDFYIDGSILKGMSIFDVSGHGIASGLITMVAKSIFQRNFNGGRDRKLSEILQQSNTDLISEIEKSEYYVTGIMLRFSENSVEYVNAGHPDLIIKKSETGKPDIVVSEEQEFKGLFLGTSSAIIPHDQMIFSIDKNDILLLYTDCLYDSVDINGREFGVERILESFRESTGSAREILDNILKSFYGHVGTNPSHDDLTVIVAKKL
jgi:sigma-B regulation protein RsbU (phosphoserine phosphatase)